MLNGYFCLMASYFERTTFTYMRYVIYYQSHHCDQNVNWRLLGVENFTNVQPERPLHREAVIRTVTIALLYAILNVVLIATSVVVLSELIVIQTV